MTIEEIIVSDFINGKTSEVQNQLTKLSRSDRFTTVQNQRLKLAARVMNVYEQLRGINMNEALRFSAWIQKYL